MFDFGGGGLCPSKKGKKRLRGGQFGKARAVVWEWVGAFHLGNGH